MKNNNKNKTTELYIKKDNTFEIFNYKNHTNGKSGTIGEKHYKKIFCLDKKEIDLAEIYTILHNKDNYNKDTAFVLNSDLNFSVAGGLDYESLNKKYYYKGNNFAPIGSDNNRFNASFYGNNHTIKVGDINFLNSEFVGFFGSIGNYGKVYDLKLKVGKSYGDMWNGGFAGYNFGKIKNSSVFVKSSIEGKDDYVGGFTGFNSGTIYNCITYVKSIRGGKNEHIGGFTGGNDGKIKNCFTVINFINGKANIGGFAGYNNNGIIENSLAIINYISSSSDYYVGGFVGENYNEGKILSSASIVKDIKGLYVVGGFVGANNGSSSEIKNCFTTSESIKGYYGVGGFVGKNYYGKINNSSAIVNNIIGEFVGSFEGVEGDGKINNSIIKVLTKSDKINNGYYYNENLTEKPKDFYITPKEQIFFEKNKKRTIGLQYNKDNKKLYITLDGKEIDLNQKNFLSASNFKK